MAEAGIEAGEWRVSDRGERLLDVLQNGLTDREVRRRFGDNPRAIVWLDVDQPV